MPNNSRPNWHRDCSGRRTSGSGTMSLSYWACCRIRTRRLRRWSEKVARLLRLLLRFGRVWYVQQCDVAYFCSRHLEPCSPSPRCGKSALRFLAFGCLRPLNFADLSAAGFRHAGRLPRLSLRLHFHMGHLEETRRIAARTSSTITDSTYWANAQS